MFEPIIVNPRLDALTPRAPNERQHSSENTSIPQRETHQ